MSLESFNSSEDSNDSYQTIFHDSRTLPHNISILKTQWEDVESTLYNEQDKSNFLKSDVVQECQLWKECFPYLRIIGTRIDTDKNIKKCKLRKSIISTVVNELIIKIAGEGLNISTDNEVHRPTAPKKESYFERGKMKQQEVLSNSEITKDPVIISLPGQENANTPIDTSAKPPLRGILKKSPMRGYGKRTEERKQRSHMLKNKTPLLPKINNRNNWLNRSERNTDCSLPPKRHNQKNKIFKQDRLILPPITPNIDIK